MAESKAEVTVAQTDSVSSTGVRIDQVFTLEDPKQGNPKIVVEPSHKAPDIDVASINDEDLQNLFKSKNNNELPTIKNLREKLDLYKIFSANQALKSRLNEILTRVESYLNNVEVNNEEFLKATIENVQSSYLGSLLLELSSFIKEDLQKGVDSLFLTQEAIENPLHKKLIPENIFVGTKPTTDLLKEIASEAAGNIRKYTTSLMNSFNTNGRSQREILGKIVEFYNHATNFLPENNKLNQANLKKVLSAFNEKIGLAAPIQDEFYHVIVTLDQEIKKLDEKSVSDSWQAKFAEKASAESFDSFCTQRDINPEHAKEDLLHSAKSSVSSLKELWEIYSSTLTFKNAYPEIKEDHKKFNQNEATNAVKGYLKPAFGKAEDNLVKNFFKTAFENDKSKIRELITSINKAILELDCNTPETLVNLFKALSNLESKIENYISQYTKKGIDIELKYILMTTLKEFVDKENLDKVIKEGNEVSVSQCNSENLGLLEATIGRMAKLKNNPNIIRSILDNHGKNNPEVSFDMAQNWIDSCLTRQSDMLATTLFPLFTDISNIKAKHESIEANRNKLAQKSDRESTIAKLPWYQRIVKKLFQKPDPLLEESEPNPILEQEDDKALAGYIGFLGQDSVIKYGLEFIEDSDIFNKKIEDPNEQGISTTLHYTKQAQLKKKTSDRKYTLTAEEIELLEQATQLKLSEDGHTFSLAKAIEDINTEIINKTTLNSSGRLFKYRTAHLKVAKKYLEFYRKKSEMSQNPEDRLRANLHRKEEDKGSKFRDEFSKDSKELSSLFKTNRAIKKLQKILVKKYESTAEEKKPASLLNKKQNIRRDHDVVTSLTIDGKTPGKFFASIVVGDIEQLNAKFISGGLHFANTKKRQHSLSELYNEVIDSAKVLDSYTKIESSQSEAVPSFNVRFENALPTIGNLVSKTKAAVNVVIEKANIFIKAQQATINGLAKTIAVLEKISETCKAGPGVDVRNLINEAIKQNEVTKHIALPDEEDIKTKSPIFFLHSEFTLVQDALNDLLKLLLNLKDINNINLAPAITSLTKELTQLKADKAFTEGRIKHLVDHAIETSDAIIYLADHTTKVLGRP